VNCSGQDLSAADVETKITHFRPSLKQGGPLNDNSLQHESDSIMSQCTDDEITGDGVEDDSNENTIVPTAGRELAQAVVAART